LGIIGPELCTVVVVCQTTEELMTELCAVV